MKGTLTKTPKGWAVKTPTETLILHPHDHPEMDTARYEGKEVEFTRKLGDWNDSPINEPHWTAELEMPFHSWFTEYERCVASPFYFATKYFGLYGVTVGEQEFNDALKRITTPKL